jgi:hypothetical protein
MHSIVSEHHPATGCPDRGDLLEIETGKLFRREKQADHLHPLQLVSSQRNGLGGHEKCQMA